MIRKQGAREWENVHLTERAQLDDLIDVDNSLASGEQPQGFELFRQAARDIDKLVREAGREGRVFRGLGSGWALTDIAVPHNGWLLNTKLLNGCFDVSDRHFEPSYDSAKRPYLVIAQCGISVGELNVHLEVTAIGGIRRALKTAGIGAGQSIAGAISGNTHGSAINYGAMPDFIVGVQIVTGSGKSLWIERASEPVVNAAFAENLGAELLRDDDALNAAIVGFGAFGVMTAVAIETDPIYQLQFPPVHDIAHADLKRKLDDFDYGEPEGLYHYEFVFDPYSRDQIAMEAVGTRVPYEEGHPAPDPVWIVRSDDGFALGDGTGMALMKVPLVSSRVKTEFQFDQYRARAILGDARATPGQLFTATVTYFHGYTESALGVSLDDASKMMEISTDVIRRMKLPVMSQVRVVHPSRALLGFTYLGPKTAVFEYGLANDETHAEFDDILTRELAAAGIGYTFHWSKNSGIDPHRLEAMYGADRVRRWRAARSRVFGGDTSLMKVFDNAHVVRAGLA